MAVIAYDCALRSYFFWSSAWPQAYLFACRCALLQSEPLTCKSMLSLTNICGNKQKTQHMILLYGSALCQLVPNQRHRSTRNKSWQLTGLEESPRDYFAQFHRHCTEQATPLPPLNPVATNRTILLVSEGCLADLQPYYSRLVQ